MTPAETARVVATLFVQYPGAEVTTMIVKLWHHALGSYPADQVFQAANEILVTYSGSYPPTIGMVAEVLRRQQSTKVVSEGEAWAILVDAVKRRGRYDQAGAMHLLRERSPLVARAAELLGWEQVCSWRTEDEVANRAHFWRVLSGLKKERELAQLPSSGASSAIADINVKNLVKGLLSDGR
jgi:hypothetical protein